MNVWHIVVPKVLSGACCAGLLFVLPVPVWASESLKGWKVSDPPKPGSVARSCENAANFVWDVRIERDELKLKKLTLEELYDVRLNSQTRLPQYSIGKFKDHPRRVVKVGDGVLVGFNRGEWGGAVYWFSPDGKRNYQVSGSQVESFVELDGRLLALEGLSHLGLSQGSLVEYKQVNGVWAESRLAKLPEAPGPHFVENKGSMLVVTDGKLVRLSFLGGVEALHTASAGFGRAGSVVKDSKGNVFIGVGDAVIHLQPDGKRYVEKWLSRPEDIAACKCKEIYGKQFHGGKIVRCGP